MHVSVTLPVGRAYERMKVTLFRPFQAGKWFSLGFCAWLSILGEGGGNFNCSGRWPRAFTPPAPPTVVTPPGGVPNVPGAPSPVAPGPGAPVGDDTTNDNGDQTPDLSNPAQPAVAPPATPTPYRQIPGTASPPPGPPGWPPGIPVPDVPKILDWLDQHWWLVVGVGVGFFVVVVALSLLLIWLHNRGRFMLLDGIVNNRGRVKHPWSEFADLANSACGFEFALNMLGMALILAAFGAGLSLALPDIEAQKFDDHALWGLLVFGVVTIPTSLVSLVLQLLLRDVVIPTMYLRQVRIREAWSIVRWEVLAGRGGTIVLFYLMRFLLGIVIVIITAVATCATCCATALPYIGIVILLPLVVFDRCYVLHFLEQLGPAWSVFGRLEQSRLCQFCFYDLLGNISGVCPECGQPIPPWQRGLLDIEGPPGV